VPDDGFLDKERKREKRKGEKYVYTQFYHLSKTQTMTGPGSTWTPLSLDLLRTVKRMVI